MIPLNMQLCVLTRLERRSILRVAIERNRKQLLADVRRGYRRHLMQLLSGWDIPDRFRSDTTKTCWSLAMCLHCQSADHVSRSFTFNRQ